MDKKKEQEPIPVNYYKFHLSNTNNPEDYGLSREYVMDILSRVEGKDWSDKDLRLADPEFLNEVGLIYDAGLCTEPNGEKAVIWYERAVALGDDLAMSNLADIYRKGKLGIAKDLKKAFDLYKRCGLPYAHFRCGEAYEQGLGTEKDLEKAKTYYRLALQEKHLSPSGNAGSGTSQRTDSTS